MCAGPYPKLDVLLIVQSLHAAQYIWIADIMDAKQSPNQYYASYSAS